MDNKPVSAIVIAFVSWNSHKTTHTIFFFKETKQGFVLNQALYGMLLKKELLKKEYKA